MVPGAELEAVAGVELVVGVGVAFAETQPALEYPDLLVDEGVGARALGEGTGRALACEPGSVHRCGQGRRERVRHGRIGWKHGRWHDVAWVQRTITTDQDPPAELW